MASRSGRSPASHRAASAQAKAWRPRTSAAARPNSARGPGQPWPPSGPASADMRGRLPAPDGGAVHQVVADQRAGVQELDRAAHPQRRVGVGPGRRASGGPVSPVDEGRAEPLARTADETGQHVVEGGDVGAKKIKLSQPPAEHRGQLGLDELAGQVMSVAAAGISPACTVTIRDPLCRGCGPAERPRKPGRLHAAGGLPHDPAVASPRAGPRAPPSHQGRRTYSRPRERTGRAADRSTAARKGYLRNESEESRIKRP